MIPDSIQGRNGRVYPRNAASHLVAVSSAGSVSEESLPSMAETVDVSVGGARVRTTAELEPGDRVRLEFALGNSVLRATARVVHSRSLDDRLREAGLEFLWMRERDRFALALPA